MTKLPDLSLKNSPRKSNKMKLIIIIIIATLLAGAGAYYYTNSDSGLFKGSVHIKRSTKKKSKTANCTYEYDASLGATYANCLTKDGIRKQIDSCYNTGSLRYGGCFTTKTGEDIKCMDFKANRCPQEEVDRAKTMYHL